MSISVATLAELVVSSSWIVEDGWTTQTAGEVIAAARGGLRLKRNRCSLCGGLGHTKRSCGKTVEQKAEQDRLGKSRARQARRLGN